MSEILVETYGAHHPALSDPVFGYTAYNVLYNNPGLSHENSEKSLVLPYFRGGMGLEGIDI